VFARANATDAITAKLSIIHGNVDVPEMSIIWPMREGNVGPIIVSANPLIAKLTR